MSTLQLMEDRKEVFGIWKSLYKISAQTGPEVGLDNFKGKKILSGDELKKVIF